MDCDSYNAAMCVLLAQEEKLLILKTIHMYYFNLICFSRELKLKHERILSRIFQGESGFAQYLNPLLFSILKLTFHHPLVHII